MNASFEPNGDSVYDMPPLEWGGALDDLGNTPRATDTLPDGRDTIVLGDVERCKDFNHLQGDNPQGFLGTCGLVSCEDILRQFGRQVTEADVVQHAVDHSECAAPGWFSDLPPESCGGTTEDGQSQILRDFGVPAHVEQNGDLSSLADHLVQGNGVILEVNAGVLWNDAGAFELGQANHAIVATGVAVDSKTGKIDGFYINDSGVPPVGDSGRFVDAETMEQAWMETGGSCVITDAVKWS